MGSSGAGAGGRLDPYDERDHRVDSLSVGELAITKRGVRGTSCCARSS